MKKVVNLIIIATFMLTASACSGMRTSGDKFAVHAESLNILGIRIPGDDHDRAMKQVPAGAQVNTVLSSPSDWTSVLGVINRIIGVSITEVNGEMQKS